MIEKWLYPSLSCHDKLSIIIVVDCLATVGYSIEPFAVILEHKCKKACIPLEPTFIAIIESPLSHSNNPTPTCRELLHPIRLNKLPKESNYTLSRELKKHGFYDQQVRIGGKTTPRIWVWRNVKLINWENPDDDDQDVLDL